MYANSNKWNVQCYMMVVVGQQHEDSSNDISANGINRPVVLSALLALLA